MPRAATNVRLVDPTETCMPLGVGDIVCTGENRHPHYEVIAVRDGRAWIRNTTYGDDHVVPIAKVRRI